MNQPPTDYVHTVLPVHYHHGPIFHKMGKLPGVLAFVDGITAAAIGAIAGSVIVIAKRSIGDVPTALIALGSILFLGPLKQLQELVIVVRAALLGLVIYPIAQA